MVCHWKGQLKQQFDVRAPGEFEAMVNMVKTTCLWKCKVHSSQPQDTHPTNYILSLKTGILREKNWFYISAATIKLSITFVWK